MAATLERDDRRKVLDATDIVRLIGEHVTLRPKGREFVGLCPFHDDHSPSMYVVPAKQIYHCFSCGAGGNALDFAIHFHQLEFLDALRLLADRAGIELTPRHDADRAPRDSSAPSRADLRAATAFAQDFFRLALGKPGVGDAARRVIESRGISAETAERFGLGAALDAWDHLLTTAVKKGVAPRALLDAGLIKPPRDGRGDGYDTFRNRLMFPICDATGRPIAFGGRRLRDEDDPKYLNSPETPIFDKSSTLYALHLASRSIQKAGAAIVTEGYTDVIACHQAGFTNVVATLGTALTPGHARVLQRLCSRVVLLFDGDEAGARAADRALDVFFGSSLDVAVAALPDGKDPADLLAEPAGAERFRAVVEGAIDALEHRLEALRRHVAGASLSARASAIDHAVHRFAALGLDAQPPIRRRLILRRVAQAAGVAEADIARALASARARPAPRASGAGPGSAARSGTAIDPALARSPEARALAALAADPSLREDLTREERDILDAGAYAPGPLRALAEALRDAPAGEASAGVVDRLGDSAARALACGLIAAVLDENESDRARLLSHLRHFVRTVLRARAVASCSADAGGPLAERIAARRRAVQTFGHDPLAIPRAVVGADDPDRG